MLAVIMFYSFRVINPYILKIFILKNLFVKTFYPAYICVFEHLNLRLGNFFTLLKITNWHLKVIYYSIAASL